jgi:hypothetical protein
MTDYDEIPDYVGAIADEPDDGRDEPGVQPQGGDCGVWAAALLLCVGVIPAIITAVFVWRVG